MIYYPVLLFIIIKIINDFARYSNSIQIPPAGLEQNVLLTVTGFIVVETFHFICSSTQIHSIKDGVMEYIGHKLEKSL